MNKEPWGELCFMCEDPISTGGSLCVECTKWFGLQPVDFVLMDPIATVVTGEEFQEVLRRFHLRKIASILSTILNRRTT